MELSSELVTQFVKATNDNKPASTESTVYGTTVEYNGKIYVRIDGSDRLTPVSTTTDMKADERVTVMIKNHTATVTGNLSSPAARSEAVKDLGNKIAEFDNIVAGTVTTEQLAAQIARIDQLFADDVVINGKLTANEASIKELQAENVDISGKLTAIEADIDDLSANKLDANIADITYATIEDLEAVNAVIYNLDATYATISDLEAARAAIAELEATKLSAEQADLRYANIDFANIGQAAIENFFSKSGMIDDLVVSDGKITGTLVGVTIIGDLIKGGTIQADKLVIKGEDGLYYKLNIEGGATVSEQVTEEDLQNGLSGSIIVAKSITAEKVAVDDLVAFGATIGGFHITEDSLYSGVKESVDNTTRGIYQDTDGQFAVGDADNFVKFYKDSDGKYRLAISASALTFATTGKSVDETIKDEVDNLQIGARNLIRNSGTLIFPSYGFHSTVYTVDVNVENGVLSLSAYSDATSTFIAEVVDGVLTVTEQYETTATVNTSVTSDILSIK